MFIFIGIDREAKGGGGGAKKKLNFAKMKATILCSVCYSVDTGFINFSA